MGFLKKNNSDVCDRLLGEIREKYEIYKTLSGCNNDLYFSFEDRYLEMLKAKVNLESFLEEEKALIYGIYDSYIEKQRRAELEAKKMEEFKKRDLVGEIADRQYAKIEKYPSKLYFSAMGSDLEKLFGAFSYIHLNVYPSVDNIFRKQYANFGESLTDIEMALFQFVCRGGSDSLPDALSRYKILSTSRDPKGLEKEKQEILKKASAFLNGFINFLTEQLADNFSFNEAEKDTLLKHVKYMKGVIADFRLLPASKPLIF